MTIHMAKGLEFPYVYVVGLEEELFPSQMMLSSRADLEEERRLFYVAITRAEKKLHFSYALNRYRYGRLKNCEPSRFLQEVDPNLIHVNRKFSSEARIPSSNLQYARKFIKQNLNKTPGKRIPYHKPSGDFKPSDVSNLSGGMKVEHPKFGFGKVINVENNGTSKKANIDFNLHGQKTLLLSFAKLRII